MKQIEEIALDQWTGPGEYKVTQHNAGELFDSVFDVFLQGCYEEGKLLTKPQELA